jgi:hypothetical protein
MALLTGLASLALLAFAGDGLGLAGITGLAKTLLLVVM